MRAGVQTAYDSVLGSARIALRSVSRIRRTIAGGQVGAWREASAFPDWTMVWGGANGAEARVHARGGERAFAMPSRSWTFYAPGVPFADRVVVAEQDREAMWLFFAVHGALPPLTDRAHAIVLDRDDVIADAVRAMAAAQERGGPGDALVAHGALLAALGHALSGAGGGAGDERDPWRVPGDAPPADGLLARVDLVIARALARPPSRAAIARALGMSESSLAHRFRAETGMTLVERVRWLRVREAQRRLERDDATVKAIASSLGFSSAFWFSRVFREVAGAPPDAWRRARRAGLSAPTADRR